MSIASEEAPAESQSDHDPTVVGAAVRRLVDDPLLAAPFAVAGLILALVDWLRLRGPVPPGTGQQVTGTTVSIAFHVYPTGVRATGLRVGAVLDLRPEYLARVLGVELLALLAVGVAGWLTFVRALDLDRDPRQLLAYLGFVVALRAFYRLFVPLDDVGLLTVVAFLVLLTVMVRLFAAPALVVGGEGFVSAVRTSATASRGQAWTLFGIVLLVGLAAWFLGSLPAGAFLSTAVVAPVHALAVVVVVERALGTSGTVGGARGEK